MTAPIDRIREIRHAIRHIQSELPPPARVEGVALTAWQDEAESIYRLCYAAKVEGRISPYARETTLERLRYEAAARSREQFSDEEEDD